MFVYTYIGIASDVYLTIFLTFPKKIGKYCWNVEKICSPMSYMIYDQLTLHNNTIIFNTSK